MLDAETAGSGIAAVMYVNAWGVGRKVRVVQSVTSLGRPMSQEVGYH